MEALLSSLKVLDFSTILPGPFATMFLADMGADVIRVENPNNPDLLRELTPFIDKEKGLSYFHSYVNRNKRSIALDLKKKESVSIVERLVKEYDIIVEQFRPGVMERLGLSYDRLSKINPKLIYCSLTGYGQTGPLKDKAGHDINFLSISGIMGYSGRKDIGPNQMGIQVADVGSGSYNSIIGILAAVVNRMITGKGRHIDVSMTDCLFPFQVNAAGKEFGGDVRIEYENDMLNGGSIYGFYEAKDGKFISFGGIESKFFNNFCEVLGLEDLKEGGVEQIGFDLQESKKRIADAIKTKPRDSWLDKFKDIDVCLEPVLTFEEAAESHYVKSRELVVNVEAPNGESIKQLSMPIKFSGFKPEYKKCGAELGEDTVEVMKSIDYSESEIEEIRSKGAFGQV